MERAVPILPADDLRIAREFYIDKLGFTIRFEATEDGTTGLLGVERTCQQAHQGDNREPGRHAQNRRCHCASTA